MFLLNLHITAEILLALEIIVLQFCISVTDMLITQKQSLYLMVMALTFVQSTHSNRHTDGNE
jgi:hypothetical protein